MKAVKAIALLLVALGLLFAGYFQGYMHGVIGGLHSSVDENAQAINAQLRGIVARHADPGVVGFLNVTVGTKPFGMQVRLGSTVVEEVFPGFPAQKLGIRSGCEIREIAGQPVLQGTYLAIFQNTAVPFSLSLFCPSSPLLGRGPLSADKHNFRVLVVRKPFGMDVQVNVLPRVVNVLPGYPAESAGVKRGFVLKAVNDMPVTASNWFDIWQKAPVPSTLTFDTDVPLHEHNPYFNQSAPDRLSKAPAPKVPTPPTDFSDLLEKDDYGDVTFTVNTKPFGMHIVATPGQRPTVHDVVLGMDAEKEGILPGDVLVEVAGKLVDASNWFAVFEQAVPPFGLRFLRQGVPNVKAIGFIGDLNVTVREKPYGMHVHMGTAIVDEVFPGFPAKKAGIRQGCQLLSIAGEEVSGGTWLSVFERSTIPFDIALRCPEHTSKTNARLPKDEHDFRVLVTQRPFGMNVQLDGQPVVIEVLPGYPAEKVGVKQGFVMKAVNDMPVDAKNWFETWQKATLPHTLTFDTTVPIHKVSHALGNVQRSSDPNEADVAEGYKDVRVKVKKIPFGMNVIDSLSGRPVVHGVVQGMPADVEGVRDGDVLVEVAGLPVDSSTWFAAFQQAVPPFGLRFRRPDKQRVSKAAGSEK